MDKILDARNLRRQNLWIIQSEKVSMGENLEFNKIKSEKNLG